MQGTEHDIALFLALGCAADFQIKDSFGFGAVSWKYNLLTRNEDPRKHSILDTLFDYIFYFGPPGKHL